MTTSPTLAPVIQIDDLHRSFGQTHALDGATLSVPPGCVFGLVGANGAGKTTLIKHILGLLKAQSGAVRVFGLDPAQHPQRVLSRIGYLSEERDLPNWMRVGELIKFQKAFYPKWDDDLAEQLRQTFNLNPAQRIKSLSKGQRARVGLLAAVAHKPDLLLLDEPSTGLDPIVRRDILSEIIRTVADEGRTVLFSSHLLEEVERVADRIAMVRSGVVILSDELDTIHATHRRITLLFDHPLHQSPILPGVIDARGAAREWTVFCEHDLTAQDIAPAARAIGAQILDNRPATLDEIFVARVQHQEHDNAYPRRAS
ncbi:MAG: ABC transporter ATP-binding protein [Planctomycetota bacterium]|jgi:ABC-2 type transport system ATP-binding protein